MNMAWKRSSFVVFAIATALGVGSLCAGAAWCAGSETSVGTAGASTDSVIHLPPVTGRYAVGVFTAYVADSSRSDTTASGVAPRQLSIEVWYPADTSDQREPAVYAPGVAGLGSEYGMLMARVRGSGTSEPRFARGLGRVPVIVLSTGRSMAAYDYTAMAEDLASHGFVVIGVNSPKLSRFIAANGEVVPPAPAPTLQMLQHFDQADAYFEPMIQQVSADLRFVVARLERADHAAGVLSGHLDLHRLGMMGHSNGALAASRACAVDQHCVACLGIEGTQAREVRKRGVRKPYALLISEQSLGYDSENVYRELGARSGSRYEVLSVRGAGHNTFTDLLLIRPTLFRYDMAPARGMEITRTAVRAFFERELRNDKRTSLEANLAPFPEVHVQREPARASGRESR